MCLTLVSTRQDPKKPYNGTKLRWKKLRRAQEHVGNKWAYVCNLLTSVIYYHEWKLGAKYTAKNRGSDSDKHDVGFHCWVDKPQDSITENEVYVQVAVEGFVASGEHFVASGEHFGRKCETWKRAKIVAVYDHKGKNITYRYKHNVHNQTSG